MKNIVQFLVVFVFILPSLVVAADPVDLDEDTYKKELGVIIIQINWGRTWKCGQYENAQLQALTFTKSPIDEPEQVTLELETPSRLFVDNKFLPYAYVVQPGEYILTAFDVKVARSTTDIMHMKGTKENLIEAGKPVGGTYTVKPGEIVYVGHFGLDCGAEPFLWRYYIDGRSEFESYIDGFRKKYPFVKDVPVQFRLFSTETLGIPYALDDPTLD
ncbi:MAG: hypothetical protein PVG66_02465 [Chromatiales bacterium]|jgi:hypothetical protein